MRRDPGARAARLSSAVDTTRDEAVARFARRGRDVQGRARRGPARGRGGHVLRAGRLRRPLPRPAPADDEADPRVQADVARGRVLARRLAHKPMLTRIYGTAFFDQADLEAHLSGRGGAPARSSPARPRARPLPLQRAPRPARRSGTRAGWCSSTSSGACGASSTRSRGYQEVRTPILFDTELWKRSGHWDNYRDKMFLTEEVEGRQFGLKPMNCPGHVEIYNQRAALLPRPAGAAGRAGPRPSQRGLGVDARPPARAAHHAGRRAHLLPLGSGRGGGRRLSRSRARDLRDVRPRRARRALDAPGEARSAARRSGIAWRPRSPPRSRTAGWDYAVNPGDGAFYAPKIDLHMTDSIGRSWQIGTIQLDGWMPQRLDATYTTSEDELGAPVHDPSRAVRLVRALHRHPHRALRRGLPALARPGAGCRAAALERVARVRRRGRLRPS